jgi:exopolysaccharide biosynthesis polyprenyl glycosylphosphotransferase
MGQILALLEVCVVWLLVSGMILVSAHAGWSDWASIMRALLHGGSVAACIVAAFYLLDLYSPPTVRDFQTLVRRLPRAFVAASVLVAGFSMRVPDARVAGQVVPSSLLIVLAAVFVLLPFRAIAARFMRSQRIGRRFLIVGSTPLAHRLAHEIHRLDSGYVVTAVAEKHLSAVGPRGDFDRIIEQTRPDRIVVALDDRRGRLPTQRLLKARVYQGVPIDEGVRFYERLTGKLALEALSPSQVIFGEGFSQSRLSLALRRGISAVVAAVGLALTAPLFGLIALAVKLDSRGPVFFAQRRIGFRGRPFTLLKFRTMQPMDRPPSEWVRDNGERITRVGRWLRRFWLDELPQLFNVIRGDMDLVGPRPHPVTNLELFVLVSRNTPECGEAIPYYALRCMVRPGVTGWAQVRYGYANDLDEEMEKLRYDLYYAKHRSLWLDLRILAETLKTLLSSDDVHSARAAATAPEAPVRTTARSARAAAAGSPAVFAGADNAPIARIRSSGGSGDFWTDPTPGAAAHEDS